MGVTETVIKGDQLASYPSLRALIKGETPDEVRVESYDRAGRTARGRTRARAQALQLLFQAEALGVSVDSLLDSHTELLSQPPLDPFAAELARGCFASIAAIDLALRDAADNWTLDRMPAMDRSLLRLAIYEMRVMPGDDVPADAVVIDEAVEIAKAYGTEESPKFVNGVLGRIAREVPSDPDAQGGVMDRFRASIVAAAAEAAVSAGDEAAESNEALASDESGE